ncbi:MAG: hypothetical protein HC822_26775, partial [Oscillochloris sp.]|nr:hypothetical protein [Oscillochloris sp.]
DGSRILDLAVGSDGAASQVFCAPLTAGPCGTGQISSGQPIWTAAIPDATSAVAWGQFDANPALDLVLANNGSNKPSQVVLNPASAGPTVVDLVGSDMIAADTVAIGNLDGNNELDIVLGNRNGASRLYLNAAGTFTHDTTWQPSASLQTTSLALADADGDGDLDLAFGNVGQSSQLYQNQRGPGILPAAISSGVNSTTRDLAWGDLDNDGDLDLAFGTGSSILFALNQCNPSNDNGYTGLCTTNPPTFTTASSFSFNPALNLNIQAIAWGDADNDGDLDLAVAVAGASDRIYRNTCNPGAVGRGCSTTQPQLELWQQFAAPVAGRTRDVAWGDLDGDGDLDLALGRDDSPSLVYANSICTPGGSCNHAPGFAAEAVWQSEATDDTFALAWGDLDGDGDLDLALGNSAQPGRLYRNDQGTLVASTAWVSLASTETRSIAWGDMRCRRPARSGDRRHRSSLAHLPQ